ncbi:MAG: AAA family ATPase [Bryobacterales bacterium]|nr:AAA family ATPase [Bryobacterales bacterium]
MEFTHHEIAAYYAARVPKLKQTDAREWRGPCPVHQGARPNFAVNAQSGHSICHSACGKGWDIIGLEQAISGKAFVDAKQAVFALLGRPAPSWNERDIEASYDYVSAEGKLLYQVVRRAGKRFSQRRPDGNGGWVWGLGGVTPVPFRLPSLVAAETVLIPEGERDVLTLERLGFVGTCNNGGAGNFKPELAHWFHGKHVGILPDNDEKGREHALKVARLLDPVAASVRIIELPGLPEKGDVSDFVAKGGTAEQIRELYERAAEWSPEWEFSSMVPAESDRYVRRFADVVAECGGPDGFWDFTREEGIPTPFARLTAALAGGLKRGEVYVIGGNQGSGKSSLALQFMLHALQTRRGVLMFSMEMGHRDVFQRLCGIVGRVDLREFGESQRNRRMTTDYTDMRHRLARAAGELSELPLLVSTKPAVTPESIIEESRRLAKQQRIDFVVVDHLQLMATTGSVRGDYERFTAISRALKQTAMELGVPVLLASQTSRSNSADRRNELEVHDLRGSGAIEEDAAAVMLLYPDHEDRKRTLENGSFPAGPVKSWLKLGKNRYGLQGSYLPLWHRKTITQFTEDARD